MPRSPAPRLDRKSGRWIAQLGKPSDRTGRRGRLVLCDEHGEPIRREDRNGAMEAFLKLSKADEAARDRRLGPTAYDVVKAYIEWHEANGSKPRTIDTHKWHLGMFLDFEWGGVAYGRRPAATFAVPDWSRYKKAMLARGVETGYVRLAFSSVHACWRWAARPIEDREPLKLIPENPFADLIRPKKGDRKKIVLPWQTIQECIRFLPTYVERESTGHRNQKVAFNRQRPANRLKALACRLILECGCRPKESAILRWDWVKEARRLIEIPKEFIKTYEDRKLGLTAGMAEELAKLRESGLSHPIWVFRLAINESTEEPDPHKLGEWFAGMRSAARRAGIILPKGTSLYTFRHSMVTLANEAGMDLRRIAPAFGHSAETAEQVYLHIGGDHIVDVMDEAREKISEKDGRKDGEKPARNQ